jgi:hypothetical protein
MPVQHAFEGFRQQATMLMSLSSLHNTHGNTARLPPWNMSAQLNRRPDMHVKAAETPAAWHSGPSARHTG